MPAVGAVQQPDVEDEAGVELADEVFETVHRNGTIGDVARVVADALAKAGDRG